MTIIAREASTSNYIHGIRPMRTRPGTGVALAMASIPWPQHLPLRPKLRTSAKVTYHCAYHVVWCTQYRAPVLTADITKRLEEVIAEVVGEKEAWLVDMDINPAFVHLVIEVSPQFGVHRLVKAIKARSARVLRTEFPPLRSRLPSLWTNAYFVTTVGKGLPSPMIERYVTNQPTR